MTSIRFWECFPDRSAQARLAAAERGGTVREDTGQPLVQRDIDQARGAERNLSAVLRYFVRPYLSVSGQGLLSHVSKPLVETIGFGRTGSLEAATIGGGSSVSGGPGIALNKGGRYWMMNAGYDLVLSRIRSDPAVSDSFGHSFGSGFAVGAPSIVRAGATYLFSRNRIESGLLFGTKQWAQRVAFDITKQVFRWMELQGRWGVQKHRFDASNLHSDNLSRDYMGLVRMSRLQLTWSRQIGLGNRWLSFFLAPDAVPEPVSGGPLRAPISRNSPLAACP